MSEGKEDSRSSSCPLSKLQGVVLSLFELMENKREQLLAWQVSTALIRRAIPDTVK